MAAKAEGRSRLMQEIVAAISAIMPPSRLGLRLSPFADYNSTRDPKPEDTYGPLAHWLQTAGLAYLHLADTNAWTSAPDSQRGKSRPSAKHRSWLGIH